MNEQSKNFELNFSNGMVSKIDEKTYQYIIELQELTKKTKITLPYFWNLTNSINQYDKIFINYYSYILTNRKLSKSQLFQDLFVLYFLKNKKNGTFLEFGATNGFEMSNSFTLEHDFQWQGVLAEPSPQWHKQLKKNRPKSTIIKECIYSETGKNLDFFVSDQGVFSTLEEFKNSDISSMPGNTKARNESGYNHKVKTISLNDVFIKHFNGSPIDYMSVDTEGSELIILENFDFGRFSPKVVTVEHNFTESQPKLDELFNKNNYSRVFKEHTQFDAWYILNE
jgi:FkbM family methyltransferase